MPCASSVGKNCVGCHSGITRWRLPASTYPVSIDDDIPDVRDGLTRKERIVLVTLHELEKELGDRPVPTAMLYGRVLERIDLSVDELQTILERLIARR